MLINLSRETTTYIPILPFLLEILSSYDFNKRHKSVTMKPISFVCLLRMSKTQLGENGFKDGVIESIYELILENAAKDSHAIYFPDLYVPCAMQLRVFLKKCRVANFCRKLKQLLDKINENRQFVERERNKIIVDLKDLSAIRNWENGLESQETPLSKFYHSWYKVHQSRKMKLLTQNDEGTDYRLPTLRKASKKNKRATGAGSDDSDNDMPAEEMQKLLSKQADRKKSKKRKMMRKSAVAGGEEDVGRDDGDIVKDTSTADWDWWETTWSFVHLIRVQSIK